MGLFNFGGNDDYDPYSYTPFDSSSLFGDVGSSSLDDYDPSSYTPFDSSSLFSDLFGGDDDVLGGYDPSSYTPFDSSFDYDFGSGSSSLDDYDPSSYTPFDSYFDYGSFGGDSGDSGDSIPSIDDIINEMYENAFYSDSPETEEEIDLAAGGDAGGPFGWGILPGVRDALFGSGSGPLGGNILGGGEGGGGILGAIFGGGGGGGLFGGGAGAGGGEGGLGSFLSGANPLMQFLMMKSLMKNDGGGGSVPIGGEAYGGPAFNYQDYQPTNLQPALMPGVGYANMGPPSPPPPPEVPGMMHGGDVRPGDITFAKLEPGEFVIQKPAVDAVGIETLEKINNMGNGGSYHG